MEVTHRVNNNINNTYLITVNNLFLSRNRLKLTLHECENITHTLAAATHMHERLKLYSIKATY